MNDKASTRAPVMVHVRDGELVDITTLLDDDLKALQLAKSEQIAHVKEQLSRARSRAAGSGDYSDADWFHRTNHALRHMGVDHQRISHEFGFRRRTKTEANTHKSVSFEQQFVNAARLVLPQDQYLQLVQIALTTHQKHSNAQEAA